MFAPELGTVQETLLITLYARATETRDPEGLLHDPAAVRMVEAIDYDFAKFDGRPSLTGACLRTLLFDHWVRRFLAEHPAGTVVEIGTGLNTRFERVDNGRVHWIDLDLPDAIALRRRFFADVEADGRREMLAASVLDEAWLERAAALPGPCFLAAEAVLPFLTEPDVRGLLRRLHARLPGCWLATETVSPRIVDHQDEHDVMSLMAARMAWACQDPKALETWSPGVILHDSRTLAELPAELAARLSPARRAMVRTMAERYADRLQDFRVNLYRLGGTPA